VRFSSYLFVVFLISSPLPERRFATFKLFYTEKTPASYEPQHFRAGDSQKDKFFFTTHGTRESPEKFSVGTMETGRHKYVEFIYASFVLVINDFISVKVGIQSIVAFLPSAENNDAAFTGTTNGAAVPSLTPLQEASHRAQQAELQTNDALSRIIVWDAEDGLGDADAEGEDDPDYVDGVFSKVNDSGVEIVVPIGIRNKEGIIEPLPVRDGSNGELTRCGSMNDMDVDNTSGEALFGGLSEYVPQRAGELVRSSC